MDAKTPSQLADLYTNAQAASASGNQRGVQVLLNRILAQDIRHQDAWQILHRQFGQGKSFQQFQQDWVQQYFPESSHLFSPTLQPGQSPSLNPQPSPPLSQQTASPAKQSSQTGTIRCPSCERIQSDQDPFCGQCGTNILTASPGASVSAAKPTPAPEPVQDDRQQCAHCQNKRADDHLFCPSCGREYHSPPLAPAPEPLVAPDAIQGHAQPNKPASPVHQYPHQSHNQPSPRSAPIASNTASYLPQAQNPSYPSQPLCPKCREQRPRVERFCGFCGTELR